MDVVGGVIPSPIRTLLMSARPWSLPASLVPVVIAIAVTGSTGSALSVSGTILSLVVALSAHAAANLANTYFDYASGLDTAEAADDRGLVDKTVSPRTVAASSATLFAVTAGAGLYIAYYIGIYAYALGFGGLCIALLYTAPTCFRPLKYIGLGDLAIFSAFGPLLMIGAAWGATWGAASAETLSAVALASIPIGILTSLILHSNNWRDIAADARAGAYTIAQGLGDRGSAVFHFTALAMVYVTAAIALAATLAVNIGGVRGGEGVSSIPDTAAAGGAPSLFDLFYALFELDTWKYIFSSYASIILIADDDGGVVMPSPAPSVPSSDEQSSSSLSIEGMAASFTALLSWASTDDAAAAAAAISSSTNQESPSVGGTSPVLQHNSRLVLAAALRGTLILLLTTAPYLSSLIKKLRTRDLQDAPQTQAQFNLYWGGWFLAALLPTRTLGRVLLGLIFYLGGVNNILMWRHTRILVEDRLSAAALGIRIPQLIADVAGATATALQMGACVLFVLGIHSRAAAAVMAVFLLSVTVVSVDGGYTLWGLLHAGGKGRVA